MPNQRPNTLGNATFVMAHELGHAIASQKMFGDQPTEKIPGQRKPTTGKTIEDLP